MLQTLCGRAVNEVTSEAAIPITTAAAVHDLPERAARQRPGVADGSVVTASQGRSTVPQRHRTFTSLWMSAMRALHLSPLCLNSSANGGATTNHANSAKPATAVAKINGLTHLADAKGKPVDSHPSRRAPTSSLTVSTTVALLMSEHDRSGHRSADDWCYNVTVDRTNRRMWAPAYRLRAERTPARQLKTDHGVCQRY